MSTPEAPLRVVEKSDALAEAAVPPPAVAPAAPARRQPITVALSVPITAHGETVTSLTLRPPTIEEIESTDTRTKTPARQTSDWIVLLGGIPRSSVLQLDPADYLACGEALGSFFTKRVPTS